MIRVLEMAKEMKILKAGVISLDSSKVNACATKHRNISYLRAGELMEPIDQNVHELLKKVEEADRNVPRGWQVRSGFKTLINSVAANFGPSLNTSRPCNLT